MNTNKQAEIEKILLEHTQLTYEVGKLKDKLIKLNAKNQAHITRQRNELAKLQQTKAQALADVMKIIDEWITNLEAGTDKHYHKKIYVKDKEELKAKLQEIK